MSKVASRRPSLVKRCAAYLQRIWRRQRRKVIASLAAVAAALLAAAMPVFVGRVSSRPELQIVGVSVGAEAFPAVELKLLNKGKQTALVTQLELDVMDYEVHPESADQRHSLVPVSASYQVLLVPKKDEHKSISVAHEVKPGESERLQLLVGARYGRYASFRFKVRARLVYNGNRRVESAPFMLSVVSPPHVLPRRAFSRGCPEMLEELRSPKDEFAALSALAELARLRDTCDEAGATLIRDALSHRDAATRAAAAEALAAVGDEGAVALLVTRLDDEDPRVQKAAARALAALGDRRAYEPLVALVARGAVGVREAAVEALGDLGDERAVGLLRQTAEGDDWSGKAEALEGLVKLRAFAALGHTTKHPDQNLRALAMKALGGSSEPEAVTLLVAGTRDPSRKVRSEAGRGLGAIGAVDGLQRCLASRYDDVRKVCRESLGRLATAR